MLSPTFLKTWRQNKMNTINYTKLWQNKQASLNQQMQHEKTAALSRVGFDVLTFIGAHPNTTVAKIEQHKYFVDDSLSTIKRIVTLLLDLGLIEASQNKKDKREKYLQIRT